MMSKVNHMAAAAVALLVAFAAALCGGCGASAVRTHATAHAGTTMVVRAAGDTIDAAYFAEVNRVASEHPQGPERDAALDALELAWAPVGIALDSCRDLLGNWLDGIMLASAAGGGQDLLMPLVRVVARLVVEYGHVVEYAAEYGVTGLPKLPALVYSLANGFL